LEVLASAAGPSIDGDLLPYQPMAPEALELSKNVPLLIGTSEKRIYGLWTCRIERWQPGAGDGLHQKTAGRQNYFLRCGGKKGLSYRQKTL